VAGGAEIVARYAASPVNHSLQGRLRVFVDRIVFNRCRKLSVGFSAQKISRKMLLPLYLVSNGQFLIFETLLFRVAVRVRFLTWKKAFLPFVNPFGAIAKRFLQGRKGKNRKGLVALHGGGL
jgi:hypothetical protein